MPRPNEHGYLKHYERELRRRSSVSSHDHYEQLEVRQVARAATAKTFNFDPMKTEDTRGVVSMLFTDGGFGLFHNPTRTGTQEIGGLYGHSSVGIVVSVGRAHALKPDAKKSSAFSTIPDSVREVASGIFADSQQVHEHIQHDLEKHEASQHFRLDYAQGLKPEFDEWEPKGNLNSNKKAWSNTISDMENAFAEWMAKLNSESASRLCRCSCCE